MTIGLIFALVFAINSSSASSEILDFQEPGTISIYFPKNKSYITPDTRDSLILAIAATKVTGKMFSVKIEHFPMEKIDPVIEQHRVENVRWFMKVHKMPSPEFK